MNRINKRNLNHYHHHHNLQINLQIINIFLLIKHHSHKYINLILYSTNPKDWLVKSLLILIKQYFLNLKNKFSIILELSLTGKGFGFYCLKEENIKKLMILSSKTNHINILMLIKLMLMGLILLNLVWMLHMTWQGTIIL